MVCHSLSLCGMFFVGATESPGYGNPSGQASYPPGLSVLPEYRPYM